MRRYLLVAAFCAAPAIAQQQESPLAKTTEQQARSYVASAFITGAAPAVLNQRVIVSPELRQYLNLPPEADGQTTYKAIMSVTRGTQITVRRATPDEIARAAAPARVSEQPMFALETGKTMLIVQYDLVRDDISFVGLPVALAAAAPVAVTPETLAATTGAGAASTRNALAPAPTAQPMASMQEPLLPLLKPDGPCVIKPVMSDQDLVNCGATPR